MTLVAGVAWSEAGTTVEVRDQRSGALAGRGTELHRPSGGAGEPDDWWASFERAWRHLGEPHVVAISVAGEPNTVVLDDTGELIRPALSWRDDRTAADARWLSRQLADGLIGWVAAVGGAPVAGSAVSWLSWLHRSEPHHWARVARVLQAHDWLTGRLCGAFVTDRGDASRTGYWSVAERRYRFDLLAVVDRDRDWADALPRVAAPHEVVGEWRGASVACGTGDTMALALGLGLTEGTAALWGDGPAAACAVSARMGDAAGSVRWYAGATDGFVATVPRAAGEAAVDEPVAAWEALCGAAAVRRAVVPVGAAAAVAGVLPGVPVVESDLANPVAAGACVQAAAVASGRPPSEVVASWRLDGVDGGG